MSNFSFDLWKESRFSFTLLDKYKHLCNHKSSHGVWLDSYPYTGNWGSFGFICVIILSARLTDKLWSTFSDDPPQYLLCITWMTLAEGWAPFFHDSFLYFDPISSLSLNCTRSTLGFSSCLPVPGWLKGETGGFLCSSRQKALPLWPRSSWNLGTKE